MKSKTPLTIFLILLALLMLMMGCDIIHNNNPVPVKPFYVIEKDASDYLSCKYTILDANMNRFEFVDDRDKYNLGDTIK